MRIVRERSITGRDGPDVSLEVRTWKVWIPFHDGFVPFSTMSSRVYQQEHKIVKAIDSLKLMLEKHHQLRGQLAESLKAVTYSQEYGVGTVLELTDKEFKSLPQDYVTKPEAKWTSFFNPDILRKYDLSNKKKSFTSSNPDKGTTLYYDKNMTPEVLDQLRSKEAAGTSLEHKPPKPIEKNNSNGGNKGKKSKNPPRNDGESNSDYADRCRANSQNNG